MGAIYDKVLDMGKSSFAWNTYLLVVSLIIIIYLALYQFSFIFLFFYKLDEFYW